MEQGLAQGRVMQCVCWAHGPRADLIGWNKPGDFDRRVIAIRQEADKHGRPNAVPQYMICGLCTALHKEATCRYPYQDDGTN